jgi:hypothetical protein
MKITFNALAEPVKYGFTANCTCGGDIGLLRRFFSKKAEREARYGITGGMSVSVTLETYYPRRTYRQLRTVWKLVTVIFEGLEGRKPDEGEKYGLYLDLLEVYGEKTASRITGKLRPRHISEADTREAAKFIEGLLYHLSEYADLPADLQADVRKTLFTWEAWRGGLPDDPLDDVKGEAEWREKHVYSEASGLGGNIELAHIVSRARAPAYADAPWNWLALTAEEHRRQHQRGWQEFLREHPHLRGRVGRAISRAYKLEELKNGTREGFGKKSNRREGG